MKKQMRVVLFAVLVLLLVTVTAIAASAATPFSTGEKSYATLAEAAAAVTNGGTITVTEDVSLSANATLSATKTYTLQGSTATRKITFTGGGLVISAGNVTIKNLAITANAANAITVKNSETKLTVSTGAVITSNGKTDTTGLSVAVAGDATLLIENGKLTGAVGSTDENAAKGATIKITGGTLNSNPNTPAGHVLRVTGADFHLTVEGGTFNFTSTSNSLSSLLYADDTSATVTITGGTFWGRGTDGAPMLYCKKGTYSVSGGAFYSQIPGASGNESVVFWANGSNSSKSDYTISGGRFYAYGDGYTYPLAVDACTSMKITGGFFTFVDTLESPDDIDLTKANKEYYVNSFGKDYCNGVRIQTSTLVEIGGGTFMGGKSNAALNIAATTVNVLISGGTFYGHRAIQIKSTGGALTVTGGNFYPNPGQQNCKLLDIDSSTAVVNIFGGNFDAEYTAAGNVTSGAVIYFKTSGTVNVYGGTFHCASTYSSKESSLVRFDAAGTLLLDKGTVVVGNGTFTGNGATVTCGGVATMFRMCTDNATLTVNAGNFVISDKATGIYAEAAAVTTTVNGGSFTSGDTATVMNLLAGNVTVNGGSFTGTGAYLINVNIPKDSGRVTVNGGSFTSGDTATVMNLLAGNVTVNGGSFTGTGVCLINVLMSKENGSFTVNGGVFTLNSGFASAGGAIIRTDIQLIPQNADQNYDPTDFYYTCDATIVLAGGLFVDNSSTNRAIIDTTLGEAVVVYDGAIFLSRYLQAYIIASNNNVAPSLALAPNAATCSYLGSSYYCYMTTATTDANKAPVMEGGAGVTITSAYEGIRFTSYIPAAVAANLPKGYSFGTLIAPADYVVAAGGFTHAKLNEWKAANSSVGTVYVDIVAKNSIEENTDGSISFSGALVSLKQQNYTRSMAAVAYVLADGVYYYSTYDPDQNARSMAYVAKDAYTAIVDASDEDHMNHSLYKKGAHSAFTEAEQLILKAYSAYNHTWDKALVSISTKVTWGSDASPNLKTAAENLKTTLQAMGCTTTGAVILVGNTGDAEVATALSEIEGNGYYVGVINGKLVIVGTTNALTMQAFAYFTGTYLTSAAAGRQVEISEKVVSNAKMVTLNADASFVFQHTREGNPYKNSGDLNKDIDFNISENHLYNYEDNSKYVDYPLVAAFEIAVALDGSADYYNYLPDNEAFGNANIHVGITQLALSTLLAGKDVGYYGYALKDGNVIISSFDDATLRLAKKLFIEDLADFAANGTYMIPVDYEFEKGYSDGFTGAFNSYSSDATIQAGANLVAKELSLLVTDFPRPKDLQLSGAVNVDSNSLELYYQNVDVTDYTAYCALLEQKGYDVYMAERAVEGNRFVTYYHPTKKITLHVMYNQYRYAAREETNNGTSLSKMFTPTLRVVAAKVDGTYVNLLPEKYLAPQATGHKTATRLTVLELSDGNFGYCYIYTLEDGTFVVLDGGGGANNAVDAERLYNVLSKLHTDLHGKPATGNPIVISAWYVSHGHGDHMRMMEYFISKYCNVERVSGLGSIAGYNSTVRVDAIIGNFASNDEAYNTFDPKQDIANMLGTDEWFKNNGKAIPYYKVHTGQRFYIKNLEFEVMYTHEDIHPWSMDYFNNTTTVIRLTAHETDGSGSILAGKNAISTMILGDLQARGSMVMRATWGDYAKSDIVMSAHHGGQGCEGKLYELIDAQVILWSHRALGLQNMPNDLADATSATQKENFVWFSNTRWLYIITSMSLDAVVGDNANYNVTMTLTKDGIVGLAEGEAAAQEFLAGLDNVYAGKAEKLALGTGIMNGGDYVGNGVILWRGNFTYPMPAPRHPDPMDSKSDTFDENLVDILD